MTREEAPEASASVSEGLYMVGSRLVEDTAHGRAQHDPQEGLAAAEALGIHSR